jgi:beta-glucanase (GH16 family)
MLPQAGQWPPEIDITEVLGHEPNKVHLTHHWGTARARKEKTAHFVGPDFSADFHVFAVEWERGRIRWLVDGVERSRSETEAGAGAERIPAEPFYLLLNTAVGGQWPGNPDETTTFPQYHDIDYVRVYRRKDSDVKPTVRITTPPGQRRGGALGDPLRWTMPKPGEDMVLTASVSDGDPKRMKVEYFKGGEKLGESTTPPYRVAWKAVKAGKYELTARASDPTGEAVVAPAVTVEVK